MSDDFFNPGNRNSQVPIAGLFARNPLRLRSKVFTNKQIVNRTRSIGFPIGGATVRTGTPTLGLQGSNTLYRAWSFANGVVSEIVFETFIPKDLADLSLATYGLMWTNLGAGNGNVRWEADYTFAKDQGPLNASTGTVVVSGGVAPAQNTLAATTSTTFPSPAPGVIGWNIVTVVLRRKGTDVSDTLGNAAGVLGLTLNYIADM